MLDVEHCVLQRRSVVDEKIKPVALLGSEGPYKKPNSVPTYEGGHCPKCGQTLSLVTTLGQKLTCGIPAHVFYPSN